MTDTETLLELGGLFLILLAVYGQTGLFFCFFLPSGGLLFMAGVLIATDHFDHFLATVCISAILAAILGNITGYWIGQKAGPMLFKHKDSRFFKKRYLITAENFYKKYGAMALSIGIFLPLIRTFGPMVAGIIKLQFSRFLLYVLIGSVAWVMSFTMAGYLIGSLPFLQPYLKYIIIAIVIAVTVPVVIKITKSLRQNQT